MLAALAAPFGAAGQERLDGLLFSQSPQLAPSFTGLTRANWRLAASAASHDLVNVRQEQGESGFAHYDFYQFGADLPVAASWYEGGFGVQARTSAAAGFRQTQAAVAAAYEVPLGPRARYHGLRFGVSFGAMQISLDENDFAFESMFDQRGFSGPSGENFGNFSDAAPDLGLGLLFYRAQKVPGNPEFNYYAGAAVHHANEPLLGLTEATEMTLSRRFTALAGGKLRTRSPFDFNGTLIWRRQNYGDLFAASVFLRYVAYEEHVRLGKPRFALMAGATYQHQNSALPFLGFSYKEMLTAAAGWDLVLHDNNLLPDANGGFNFSVIYTPRKKPEPGVRETPPPALPFPDF